MITFPMLPGVEIPLLLLIFIAFSIGTISGFVGVGGGFIMTPILIIMGFPAQMAVGTVVLWILGNAIIGTLRHRRLGNVDIKLGILMVISMLIGTELGIRALDAAADAGFGDTAVLSVSICSLILIGGSTLIESLKTKAKMDRMRKEQKTVMEDTGPGFFISFIQKIRIPPVMTFEKAGITASVWPLILIGFIAGVLAGFIGVGGGFLTVPSMVYLFGVPSFVAVGTSLFQIIFSAGFGAARYTMEGNVIIFASFIMILGSSSGIWFGAQLSRHLQELAMRYILSMTIMVAVVGSALKMAGILAGEISPVLNTGINVITFGGLAMIICLVTGLYITAVRHSKGQSTPVWLRSFIRD